MACCGQPDNQGSNGKTKSVCRVCELLDGDTGEKFGEYCQLCKAFICTTCVTNMPRRTLAFGATIIEKIKTAIT